jgi:hypothetical protein
MPPRDKSAGIFSSSTYDRLKPLASRWDEWGGEMAERDPYRPSNSAGTMRSE